MQNKKFRVKVTAIRYIDFDLDSGIDKKGAIAVAKGIVKSHTSLVEDSNSITYEFEEVK